jgi:hypothetical protein
MHRTVASLLLLLACAASLAGCRSTRSENRSSDIGVVTGGRGGAALAVVDEVIKQLKDFTEELAGKVESASDPKEGVDEAQKLLDSRKSEMTARIAVLKRGPLALDAAAKGRWLEAEVEGTQRVSRLKVKYLDASMRDPELKAALDRLAADYDAMFKDR